MFYFCFFLLYLKNFSDNKSEFPAAIFAVALKPPFNALQNYNHFIVSKCPNFHSTNHTMQFNAQLNKYKLENDFTPLPSYTAALKLLFSKPLGHNHITFFYHNIAPTFTSASDTKQLLYRMCCC